MARRPMKPCKHRGCGALVADGKSHCDQHAHEAVKWKSDAVRGNRHARGYGTAWDKIRQRILRRDSGLCQPCLQAGRVTVATAVDHVISKARGEAGDGGLSGIRAERSAGGRGGADEFVPQCRGCTRVVRGVGQAQFPRTDRQHDRQPRAVFGARGDVSGVRSNRLRFGFRRCL
ncbi:putative phage endonuclease [Burkholderia pseudomallei]|nr:putative phage endonuclease [Burkholderia pseudomallei]